MSYNPQKYLNCFCYCFVVILTTFWQLKGYKYFIKNFGEWRGDWLVKKYGDKGRDGTGSRTTCIRTPSRTFHMTKSSQLYALMNNVWAITPKMPKLLWFLICCRLTTNWQLKGYRSTSDHNLMLGFSLLPMTEKLWPTCMPYGNQPRRASQKAL